MLAHLACHSSEEAGSVELDPTHIVDLIVTIKYIIVMCCFGLIGQSTKTNTSLG